MQALLVTRGGRGMALFEPEQPTEHIPIFGSDEIADVTGAGDTVIATMTLALSAGASFYGGRAPRELRRRHRRHEARNGDGGREELRQRYRGRRNGLRLGLKAQGGLGPIGLRSLIAFACQPRATSLRSLPQPPSP